MSGFRKLDCIDLYTLICGCHCHSIILQVFGKETESKYLIFQNKLQNCHQIKFDNFNQIV